MQLRGGALPMGRIPKPALAVLTNACNTYIKWAEIWERMYGMPAFTLDVPGTTRPDRHHRRPGNPDFERDRRYVAAQLRELIPLLEQITRHAVRHRPAARDDGARQRHDAAAGSACSS